MTSRSAAFVVACGLFVVACGEDTDSDSRVPASSEDGDTTTTTTVSSSGPTSSPTTVAPDPGERYAVEQSRVTYDDETRILPAGSQTPEQPSRPIDVWVDVPVTDGERPLVVFAHGLTGHPRSHEMLRTHLAAEGFVVVSPAFPLTNNDVPGGFANAGDTEEQVKDVSFLIDAVMADPRFASRIDPARIGMIGHSLGGLTTAGAALATTGDQRISAAVVMSAGFGEARADLAVMVVHGELDDVVPYASSENSYPNLTGRRMFVTLVGGDHLIGILDDETDLGVSLRGLAAAFFAHELGTDEGQIDAIDQLPLEDVVIEAGTSAGPLSDWQDYFSD